MRADIILAIVGLVEWHIGNCIGLMIRLTGVAKLALQEHTLTMAHVGDSRGVLCRGGKAIELTHDHKPVRRTFLSLPGHPPIYPIAFNFSTTSIHPPLRRMKRSLS